MTPRRRNLLVAGLVAGTALGAGALVASRVLRRSPEIHALENARFVDLQGAPRALIEWRGKIVIANFWATWCAPCLEEIPLLVATRRSYAQKKIEVVGIAIDQAAKVEQFAAKMQIDYPILLAESQGLSRQLRDFQRGAISRVFNRRINNASSGVVDFARPAVLSA